MKRDEVISSIERTLGGLKDFQQATVDTVHHQLFEQGQKSMLVADEVGLGKTIVAKGVIATELKARLERGVRRPFKVTYICSNQVIAGDNVKKLNVFSDHGVIDRLARRIAYLAYMPPAEDAEIERVLSLATLTPGTSFNMGSRSGTKFERRIIYKILSTNEHYRKRFTGLSCMLRGPVRKDLRWWRRWLKEPMWRPLREDLPDAFFKILRKRTLPPECMNVRESMGVSAKTKVSLDEAVYAMAGDLWAKNYHKHRQACYELILELRRVLNEACLNYINADLYILDEFQRFSSLIDSESQQEEALTAKHIFGKKRAKVLLLSATPFKAFTGALDEAQGDDHYRDFRRVLTFLAGAIDGREELLAYDANRQALLQQLLHLNREHFDLSTAHREKIEGFLRRYICRTERQSVAADPSTMIADLWRQDTLPFDRPDIDHYVATDRIAQALAASERATSHQIRNPVEYCKSTPFPFSFLDGYLLKKLLADAKTERKVRKAITDSPAAWLNLEQVNNYRLQIGAGTNSDQSSATVKHARLSQLVDHAIGAVGEKLLWIPPSLPYYPLEGAFENTTGFSKTLVFSAWIMVPRAIASLVSYEVERRTVGHPATRDERELEPRTYFAPPDKPKHRRHPVPLLRFSQVTEDEQRVANNMTNFCLLYPSPSLVESISQSDMLGQNLSLDQHRSRLVEHFSARLKASNLNRLASTSGASEKWYWAAPLLLDRNNSDASAKIQAWFGDPGFHSSDFFTAGIKGAAGSAKERHTETLMQAFDDPTLINLGPMPADLCEVLVDMALGSPAILAARSLTTTYGSEMNAQALTEAFQIANAFLSLYNKPESIAAVRLHPFDGPFWRHALRYGAEGCLQAVLDEYLHLQRGQIGNRTEVVRALSETANLNTSSIQVDSMSSFLQDDAKKMRCHYAVPFGNQKIETDDGQKRASNLRANFNSPFRPFVLATTSIGQEGLDFHQYCRRIVHWNLPGNPIDLEQREGRINRYKGLVIRQELAQRYGGKLDSATQNADVWTALFRMADQLERVDGKQCELLPYWHVDAPSFMIERVIPMYPYSRDQVRLDRILKTLAIYRLAFGQPRQVELIDQLLAQAFSQDEVDQICEKLMINLSPLSSTKGA